MTMRRWGAALSVAVALSWFAAPSARTATTVPFDPDAVVSNLSTRVVRAPRGPRGTTGALGSGRRVPGSAEATVIGSFAGPALGAPMPADLTESLLGFDTRIQIFDAGYNPARMVALITFAGNQWCTGFLIGPDTLATAGHCVHSGGGGRWYAAAAFRVYPGFDSTAANPAPFGSCGVRSLHATDGWTVTGDDRRDYGAMKLDCRVGDRTGWFGWWWQTKSLDGQLTKIVGYPGDKAQEMWKSRDYVRVTEPRRVYYANDTVGGNSGSPVFRFRGATEISCQGNCVMAIHAYGVYGAYPTGTYNHGTRVTRDVSDNFFLWRGM